MSCQNIATVTGKRLLFLGTSTAKWGIPQFKQAAQFAKSHGIDTLLLKCADGGYWWYGGIAGYRTRRDAIKAEGVGCIPYTYAYGNTYGVLDTEIDILLALLAEPDNVACADLEAEWNNQTVWATHMASRLQGKGTFLVSTWADPSWQKWTGVIQALNPCVSVYMPQQYSNFLGTFWQEFGNNGAACLQPTLNMTQDFGTNNPVELAKAASDQGHASLSIWYYETAVANAGLLDQILAAFSPLGGQTPMTTQVPSGWIDDGATLYAPDKKFPVVLGFRAFILNPANKWDPSDYPIEAERGADPVEMSNTGLGAGSEQKFRMSRLGYAQGKAYKTWMGIELAWYEKQLATLQSHIADLQTQLATAQPSAAAAELATLQTKVAKAVQDLSS